MSLFPERQAAVRVLYEAASQLLSYAADDEFSTSRELCRTRVKDCTELAEKIAGMEPVKVTCDNPTALQVEGTPFDLGYIIRTKHLSDLEDNDKS